METVKYKRNKHEKYIEVFDYCVSKFPVEVQKGNSTELIKHIPKHIIKGLSSDHLCTVFCKEMYIRGYKTKKYKIVKPVRVWEPEKEQLLRQRIIMVESRYASLDPIYDYDIWIGVSLDLANLYKKYMRYYGN